MSTLPLADLASPYDLVAAHSPVQARTKRQLLAASREVERAALTERPSLVLVTFQDKRHLTAPSRDSYAALARRGARVYAFARSLVSDYRPASAALATVALLSRDPLVLEWDIVVLGPHRSLAFVARDLDADTPVAGADLDRRFSWTRTEDPELVTAAAAALLARVPEQHR